ncbi:MAG: ion channel [Arenimonas sp.]
MGYPDWDANLLVVAATFAAVAMAVLVHYEGLSFISGRLARRREHYSRRKVLYAIFGVLGLHVIEIWILGITLWALLHYPGAGSAVGMPVVNLLDCIYLSAESFSTVGFGDIAPQGPIRFLAGTTSLTGFVLITWSASFTYLEMERFWRK